VNSTDDDLVSLYKHLSIDAKKLTGHQVYAALALQALPTHLSST